MKATALLLLGFGALVAQIPDPTQQQPALPPANSGPPMPVFRVTLVSRTTQAVNYPHRTGSTHIFFRGTELMPLAKGEARVESQMGSTKIETTLNHLTPANQYGPEYMTYVLWAITPEGRVANLGEVGLQGDRGKLRSTTNLQTFGLIVTAEPYFAVNQPSDVVVAENFMRNDTGGTIQQVEAKFELLQRGQYVLDRGQYQPVKVNPKGPLHLAQAQNAVEIARLAGAEQYAADTFHKALVDLKSAEAFLNKGNNRKESETNAREAAQMAENARVIAFRGRAEVQLANERAAAAQREAEAQRQARESAAQAKLEQEKREFAQAASHTAEQARIQAEQAQTEPQQVSALAARDKAAAETAREAAEAQQAAAKAEGGRVRPAAEQAEAEKSQLRERLRLQLNTIFETRDSARGLIVYINDVLFNFNKYPLKPGAREKLAKVAGILLAYPSLKVQLEGHTDSFGTEEYNLKLSSERADAVRDYLVLQSVPIANLTATGLGNVSPVASNETAAGRQQNRRVEMVVSGEQIGVAGLGQQRK